MSQPLPEEEQFTPKTSVIEMTEEQIRLRADVDSNFGSYRCDIDGAPLADHTYLKISMKHRRSGEVRGAKIIECTVKGEEGHVPESHA